VGNAFRSSVLAIAVSSININAHAGNDTVRLDSERLSGHDGIVQRTWVRGGPGNDKLFGGMGSDRLEGYTGADILNGGRGRDVLVGGDWGDWLFGGSGDDELFGGAGNDWIYGMDGSDWLWGGEGDDRLDGGAGIDFVWGGVGADVFYNFYDFSSGQGFFSPTTHYYAQYPGIQDFNSGEGDRIF
jgi:Ca2+-binding RTX toxin-like protein